MIRKRTIKDNFQKLLGRKQVSKEELLLYSYVEEKADLVASDISEVINASDSDEGGIIFVEGPKNSGKTLTALRLIKLISKKKKLVCAQPKLDRPDICDGYFYSRLGIKKEVISFATAKEIKEIFDENDVVLVDEVMFIPYELQGLFMREVESFAERGGWFVGFGILWTGQKSEFLISALLLERAKKAYRLTATCQKCGRRNAVIGQRLVEGRPPQLGDPEILPPSEKVTYEPRCWDCFVVFS